MPQLNFSAQFAPLVESGQKRQTIRAPRKKQAGVLAAFAFAMPSGPEVREWFLKLIHGDDLRADEPLGMLHRFLTSDEAILLSRGNDRALAELTLQTLWLVKHGKRPESLQLSTEGADYYRHVNRELVQRVRAIFQEPEHSRTQPAAKNTTQGRKAA